MKNILSLLGRQRPATVTELHPSIDRADAQIYAIPDVPLKSTRQRGKHVRDGSDAYDSNVTVFPGLRDGCVTYNPEDAA